MSYLDDLKALFDDDSDDDVLDARAVEVDGDPLEIARRQLDDCRAGYCEWPEGTFHGCGSRHGCGYAEATAVVDPQTGLASVDIDTHLRVAPGNVKGMRKAFRRLNNDFIVPGLTVDDDGSIHFRPAPCDLKAGDDLGEWLGKGFSTVHAHAHMAAQLDAGMSPFEVLEAHERAGKQARRSGLLEALHGMFE